MRIQERLLHEANLLDLGGSITAPQCLRNAAALLDEAERVVEACIEVLDCTEGTGWHGSEALRKASAFLAKL